jgi:hypothetical protein
MFNLMPVYNLECLMRMLFTFQSGLNVARTDLPVKQDIIFYIQPALLYPAVFCRTLLLVPLPVPVNTLIRKNGGDSK